MDKDIRMEKDRIKLNMAIADIGEVIKNIEHNYDRIFLNDSIIKLNIAILNIQSASRSIKECPEK